MASSGIESGIVKAGCDSSLSFSTPSPSCLSNSFVGSGLSPLTFSTALLGISLTVTADARLSSLSSSSFGMIGASRKVQIATVKNALLMRLRS